MTFEILFVIILIAQGAIGIYSARKIPNEDKHFKYAGFWLRLGAGLIDGVVFAAASIIIGFLFGYDLFTEESFTFYDFVATVAGWLYYAIMQSSKHRATLGMMAVGIQIVDMDGNEISFWRATGRLLATILSFLTLVVGGFGYFMMGWTKQKQALHDKIADCLVIRKNG